MGQWADELEEGTQCAGGFLVGARHDGIGLPVLDHHGSKIVGFNHDGLGGRLANVPVAFEFFEALAEERQIFSVERVNDADVVEFDLFPVGDGLDGVVRTEKDGGPEAEFEETGGGSQNTGLGAFWENDPFWAFAQLVENARDKFHDILSVPQFGRWRDY